MSRKCLSEHQISEILKYLDDMEVDSEEELIDKITTCVNCSG